MITLLAALLLQVSAAPTGRTIFTEAKSITSDGKLVSCEIDFGTMASNSVYKRNASFSAIGSVALFADATQGQGFGASLTLYDIQEKDGKLGPAHPPANISLIGASGDSNAASRVEQNVLKDGGLLAAYKLDDSFLQVAKRIRERSEIEVVFNKASGDVDVHLIIDLTVARSASGTAQHNDTTRADFTACAAKLVQSMK